MGFIYNLGELFGSVLVFITIRLHDLDTMLIVMEDRRRGNGIEHVGDDFRGLYTIEKQWKCIYQDHGISFLRVECT